MVLKRIKLNYVYGTLEHTPGLKCWLDGPKMFSCFYFAYAVTFCYDESDIFCFDQDDLSPGVPRKMLRAITNAGFDLGQQFELSVRLINYEGKHAIHV